MLYIQVIKTRKSLFAALVLLNANPKLRAQLLCRLLFSLPSESVEEDTWRDDRFALLSSWNKFALNEQGFYNARGLSGRHGRNFLKHPVYCHHESQGFMIMYKKFL